jgi:hypothetical protein
MSIEAMVWALEKQGLDPTDKLVLLGIANHADRYGGNAYPSLATLAIYVGRSEQTVRRSVRRLEQLGLVTVVIQGGQGRHAGRRSNLYQLSLATPITGDSAPLSPVIREGYQGSDRRTVQEPSIEPSTSTVLMDGVSFERFWDLFPRKVGKLEARKAFNTIGRTTDAPSGDELINGIKALIAEGRDERFIPHPATWLRQGRWSDEVKPIHVEPIPVKPRDTWVIRTYCGNCRDGYITVTMTDGSTATTFCECVKATRG